MTDAMDSFVNGPLSVFADALAHCKTRGGYTVRESAMLDILDKALSQMPKPGE